MINSMNKTTINANPEEPCPWLYPLIGAPPLSLYGMQILESVLGSLKEGTFLSTKRFYGIVSHVAHNS